MTTDRIAGLERIVYGSGPSDEEREKAARELFELRAVPTAAESADEAGARIATDAADADAADADATAADATAILHAPDPRRRVRRVIIAATAALVIGVLAGWQLGAREAEQQTDPASAADSLFPGPRTQAEYLAARPVAADSPATEVFDRPATSADVPAVPWRDFGNSGAEIRLLATRGDGASIYAVHDGEYCLFFVFAGPQAGTMGCTENGRFPADGVRGAIRVDGPPEAYFDVTWRPDGSLSVLVPAVEQETLPPG